VDVKQMDRVFMEKSSLFVKVGLIQGSKAKYSEADYRSKRRKWKSVIQMS
jgi:hypothetical protein